GDVCAMPVAVRLRPEDPAIVGAALIDCPGCHAIVFTLDMAHRPSLSLDRVVDLAVCAVPIGERDARAIRAAAYSGPLAGFCGLGRPDDRLTRGQGRRALAFYPGGYGRLPLNLVIRPFSRRAPVERHEQHQAHDRPPRHLPKSISAPGF